MNQKDRILEAWIMVEHLSEGDINVRDKNVHSLCDLQGEDYYTLFLNEMKKHKMKSRQKGGIVLFFDIFPFSGIVDFLREKYHLSKTEQEIYYGDKFSFALYFDKQLNLDREKTFLTESYYIRRFRRIPKEAEFLAFEEEYKKVFEEIFECPAGSDQKTHFNTAMESVLRKNGIEIKNCRMKAVLNLETDATNLHSFFTGDLEKAKMINSDLLDLYLLGDTKERIDLDSRIRSSKFNADAFYNILQPKNYPVARFPGNPKYALSFMQQVAVNLAIGFDHRQMRSVNGPPGTGKSTLLRDIFAELVVEQAREMAALSEKLIKGTEATQYWKNASIGVVPEKIADRGIVVASSNNGAVQNIVNELPLVSEIDKTFIGDLFDADYFKTIANSKVQTQWVEDENGKHEVLISERNEDDIFWGLFSLEGGRKDHMDYIITALKHVVHYLQTEYESNDTVYQEFQTQYDLVKAYRQEKQDIAETIKKLYQLRRQIREESEAFDTNREKKKSELAESSFEIFEYINNIKEKIDGFEREMGGLNRRLSAIEDEKSSILQCIEALKLQKPRFFSPKKEKIAFKEKNKLYSDQLQNAIGDERIIRSQVFGIEEQINELQTEIEEHKGKLQAKQEEFLRWEEKEKSALSRLRHKAEELEQKMDVPNINELDFTVDYETLQLSNPWFDIEYRRMQSRLFILALKVRKQFLYENVKNVKAACIIWNKQKDYLAQKQVIEEAWHWINLVIPVISSTFASFARMCANIGQETIGYLFVDEAGQALPQAGVGAIFRSRQVMVVGDPSQIKPVLTLDSSILHMLGEYYGVSQKYLSEDASVQTLVDEISRFGFYRDENKEKWIGIPLWVHRRCRCPMFDISNKISYDGNMVQGIKEKGYAEWIDVEGKAIDKYVAKQGVLLREKIQKMIEAEPDIINKEKKDIIYVITPFKNVAFQLAQELKKIGFTRYDANGKPTNVGTVHTFQGKEARAVFLVLGADESTKGAANWAVGTDNPNIMNVAATRAKEEFCIIGSRKLYLGLQSDVIKMTDSIIAGAN